MKWSKEEIELAAISEEELGRRYNKPETISCEELCPSEEIAEDNRFDEPAPEGLGVLGKDFWIIEKDGLYGICY